MNTLDDLLINGLQNYAEKIIHSGNNEYEYRVNVNKFLGLKRYMLFHRHRIPEHYQTLSNYLEGEIAVRVFRKIL